jgi:hypothetical protein
MRNIKTCIWISVFIFYVTAGVTAQEANLIFLGTKPQKNFYNPAVQLDSLCIIFSPHATFNLGSNTFGLKETFKWDYNKEYKYWDVPYLLDNANDENFINLNLDYSFLFIGKKLPKGFYSSFSINQRNSYNFLIPGGLLELSRGNAEYETELSRDFDLDGLSVNGLSYTAYSFGLSRKFSPAFQFGLHFKLLSGNFVTKTLNFEASINTRNDFKETYVKADILYQQSSPGISQNQSDDYTFSPGDFSQHLSWHTNFFKNLGAAIDFGFEYTPDFHTTIFGSVSDIGFIKWNSGQEEVHLSGAYSFTGFEISPGSSGKFNFEETFNLVMDSIKTTFNPNVDKTSAFRTHLTSQVLLGLQRSLNPKFDFFSLFQASVYSYYTDYRFALGALYKPNKHLRLNISTAYKNEGIGNLGAGMVYAFNRFELFIASGNIEYLIYNSRSINLALGVNIRVL